MSVLHKKEHRLNLRKGVARPASDDYVPERFRPPPAAGRFSISAAFRAALIRVVLITAVVILGWLFRADWVRAAEYAAERMQRTVPVMPEGTLFSEDVCLDIFNTERLYAGDRWSWKKKVQHEWRLWLLYRRLSDFMDEAIFAASETDIMVRMEADMETALPMLESGNRLAWRDVRGGVFEGRIVEVGNPVIFSDEGGEPLEVDMRVLPVTCRLRLDKSFRDAWIRQFARVSVLRQFGLCLCRKKFDSEEAVLAAATEGNPQALFRRAVAALRDKPAADYAAAFRDFYCAALLHHPAAQYRLGMLYYNGRGVDTDRDKGLMWITRANLLGHREATQSLHALNQEIVAYKSTWRRSMELEEQERRRHALELTRVSKEPRYDIIQMYESPFACRDQQGRGRYYSGRGGHGPSISSADEDQEVNRR